MGLLGGDEVVVHLRPLDDEHRRFGEPAGRGPRQGVAASQLREERSLPGSQGVAGRSGGDEFTILLDADAGAADGLLRRLRERLEPITVFEQTFQFNLSAGVCQDDGTIGSLEQMTALVEAMRREVEEAK